MDTNVLWTICQSLNICDIRSLCVTCKDYHSRTFKGTLFWIYLLKRDFGEHFSDKGNAKELYSGGYYAMYKDLYTKGAFLHIYRSSDLAKGISIRKLRCLTAFGKPINVEVHFTRDKVSERSVKRIPFSKNTYCSKYMEDCTLTGEWIHSLDYEGKYVMVYDD